MFIYESNTFSRKLKLVLNALPIMLRNTLAAFPERSLRVSASLFIHFFKASLSFSGENPGKAGSPP